MFLAPRVNARGAASGAEVFFLALGGGTFRGADMAVSARGGTPLHTCFGGGGRRTISRRTRTLVGEKTPGGSC